MDTKWDYKPKLWSNIPNQQRTKQQSIAVQKWEEQMNNICKSWTMEELIVAINKCRNNVAYKGMVNILLIKNAPHKIYRLLLIIYNVWKEYGTITNNQNRRNLNPQPKPNKNSNLVGNLRPIEWGYPLMKIYSIMVYNRLYDYIITNNILSIHQYASKQSVGAEDCLRDITNDINNMINNQFPPTLHTKDASDAYNNMKENIINDKFAYHVGLNHEAMIMFKSLTANITTICILDGIQSQTIIPTNSKYSQGYTASSLVWNIYINPLLLHLDNEYQIKGGISNQVVAKIQPKVLMDDITIYTLIFNKHLAPNQDNSYKKKVL